MKKVHESTPSLEQGFALGRYSLLLAALWTAFIFGLGLSSDRYEKQVAHELIRNEARSLIVESIAFRNWVASHGGAYVPPTDRTSPNPHLAHLPHRDVETTTGQPLTLMNPAYMLRQMMEDNPEIYGVGGHITSLDPIRPENAATSWERTALEAFERGEAEVRYLVCI